MCKLSNYFFITKSGLISKCFSLWLESPTKSTRSQSWALSSLKRRCSRSWFGNFFLEIWVKVKKLSEIKPPLVKGKKMTTFRFLVPQFDKSWHRDVVDRLSITIFPGSYNFCGHENTATVAVGAAKLYIPTTTNTGNELISTAIWAAKKWAGFWRTSL